MPPKAVVFCIPGGRDQCMGKKEVTDRGEHLAGSSVRDAKDERCTLSDSSWTNLSVRHSLPLAKTKVSMAILWRWYHRTHCPPQQLQRKPPLREVWRLSLELRRRENSGEVKEYPQLPDMLGSAPYSVKIVTLCAKHTIFGTYNVIFDSIHSCIDRSVLRNGSAEPSRLRLQRCSTRDLRRH